MTFGYLEHMILHFDCWSNIREEYAEKEREIKEETERKQREVNLEIRFHFYHRVEKGVLTSEEEPVKLTCERKQTLEELFGMIALVKIPIFYLFLAVKVQCMILSI